MTGLPGRPVTTRAAALLSGMAMLAAFAGLPGAPACARPAGAGRAAAGIGTVAPGTNLLLNPGAQTGAASRNGWDAVTISGWQVVSGLATAVRYGTRATRPPPGAGP